MITVTTGGLAAAESGILLAVEDVNQPLAASAEDRLDAPGAELTALRGSAFRVGGYALSMLLSLVSAPLLVRHLGVADYGAYIAINAAVTIVAGISELGLTSLGTRDWVQAAPPERRGLMRNLVGARLGFALVGAAFAMVFALLAGYDAGRLLGMALVCVGLLVMALQSALTIPLVGGLRQGWIALMELARQLVQVLLLVVLVVAGAGLVPILGAIVPAALISCWLTAYLAREWLVWPEWRPARWTGLLRGAASFSAASAVSILYFRLTVILTSLVTTATASGHFAIAFRVLEILINIPGLLLSAVFPLLVRAAVTDSSRLRAGITQALSAMAGLGTSAGVVVATGAPVAVTVLAGSRPAGAVDSMRILGGALAFSFIAATAQYSLLAIGATRSILTINLAALALNVGLTIPLAGSYGAVGAAGALAACELLIAVLSWLTLSRRLNGLALPSSQLARIAIVVALAAGCAVGLSFTGAVVSSVLASAVGGLAALALNLVPRRLLVWLTRPAA